MSMVPCKYYARNECRFGDSCRFYHARGSNNQIIQGGAFRPQVFNQNQQAQLLASKSQQNMETMIEMVKRDMVEWDRGGIFPFSCYGPAGGKPCLPALHEEISVDELRYRYYANNKTPVDLSRELLVVQQARMNYQQLSPAIRNILERVIGKGENITSPGWGGGAQAPSLNVFGGGLGSPASQSSSIFGGSQAQTNPFGQTSSPSLFGNPSPASSPPASNSLFGSPTPQGNTSNVFGGQASSLFGIGGGSMSPSNPQPQTAFGGSGIFGASNTASPSGTMSGTSIFGDSASVFGGNAQANLISPSQPQTGLFSPQPNANVFGGPPLNPQSPSSIFGAPQAQAQTQNQFHSPTLQSLLQTPPQSNIFAVNPSPQQTPSLFGSVGTTQIQPSGLPASGSFFGSSPQPQAVVPTSIFGGGLTTQSEMMMSSTPSLFGTPPLPIAGNQNTSQSSLFGSPTTANFQTLGTSLGPTTIDQKYVYTEESELSAEELEAFRAPTFTLENIPIRPPPKSLC